MNREPNYELLFEYVYGLLDSNDPVEQGLREQIEKHLALSPEWQAALAAVKAQQGLLSQAARIAASDVVFAPPAGEPAAVKEPAPPGPAVARPAAPYRSAGWRWVAVAVCIALLGLGGWFQMSAAEHRERLAAAEQGQASGNSRAAASSRRGTRASTTGAGQP